MRIEDVAILLLAGGRSERFGEGDKLLADLNGLPVGLHTATNLGALSWRQKIAITSGELSAPLAGLGYAVLPATENGGMGDNIAKALPFLHASAVVIVLADMPFVTQDHVHALVVAATDVSSLVATSTSGNLSPPVLFGRSFFTELERLSGDAGARAVLRSHTDRLKTVEAAPDTVHDIDTVSEWMAARNKSR